MIARLHDYVKMINILGIMMSDFPSNLRACCSVEKMKLHSVLMLTIKDRIIQLKRTQE